MESHEEKLLAMVQESKMNQAREIMKQKEREFIEENARFVKNLDI